MNNLKAQEKLFDEKFVERDFESNFATLTNDTPDDIKQFWCDYVKNLLEGIVTEESPHQAVSEYYSGYNKAIKELQEKVNQILNN
jgi:hypothetical protein